MATKQIRKSREVRHDSKQKFDLAKSRAENFDRW